MVVVLRFLFKVIVVIALVADGFASQSASSDYTSGYIGLIQAHTAVEIEAILQRIDELRETDMSFQLQQPLVLVLHGDEANAFLRKNYHNHRTLVDQAARLEAFNAVNIQVCETWLRNEDVDQSQLPAFVETVPYGPAREQELLEQGFQYF